MPIFQTRYAVRFLPEEGKYVPESKFSFLWFRGSWEPYHQPVPCDDEIICFDGVQEAIAFLEKETGKPRRFLDIQYFI